MDRTGRVVIPPAFVDERDFFHGLAAVELPEGKWGFVNESGKLSIPARFDEVRDFIDDLAPVRMGRSWDTSRRRGEWRSNLIFKPPASFTKGWRESIFGARCSVRRENLQAMTLPYTRFTCSKTIKAIFQNVFLEVESLDISTRPVESLSRRDSLLPRILPRAWPQFASKESSDSKYGYIDRTGHMAIAPRFNQAGSFSEGLAAVETSARVIDHHVVDIAWGFIDKAGVLKIPDRYNFAGNFSEGLARVAIQSAGARGILTTTEK